jgi:predicted O-methyltransferase YrrM
MDYQEAKSPSHFEYVVPRDKNRAAEIRNRALAMMDELTGWCSKEKGAVLVDLILKTRPRIIVEIGVWGGKSLVPMACALKANEQGIIYGIDPWDSKESVTGLFEEVHREFWSRVDHESILTGLLKKIEEFRLADHIELVRCTSENAAPIFDIDILHIDGNHSEKTSYFDVTKWVPLVKKGGWIFFDDIHWFDGKETTARSVEWLNANCIKIAEFSEQFGWGIWIRP